MYYYEYRGYKGRAVENKATGRITGMILEIAQDLFFSGSNEEEAREAFCNRVEKYIEEKEEAEADYLDDYLMYGE